MDEIIGFVTGNIKREKILSLIASKGPTDGPTVAKTTHIVSVSTEKILTELLEKGLISNNEGKYSITDTGRTIEGKIRSLR